MRKTSEPLVTSDIAVGEMEYARHHTLNQATIQIRQLSELLARARFGIIIDCQKVQLGTSDVLNILAQVSKRARQEKKLVALFNVPGYLEKTIKIAGLKSVLEIFPDGIEAKQRLEERCGIAPSSGWTRRWGLRAASILAIVSLSVFAVVLLRYLREL